MLSELEMGDIHLVWIKTPAYTGDALIEFDRIRDEWIAVWGVDCEQPVIELDLVVRSSVVKRVIKANVGSSLPGFYDTLLTTT